MYLISMKWNTHADGTVSSVELSKEHPSELKRESYKI